MPNQLFAIEKNPSMNASGVECRVYDRHSCEIPASCRPTSGGGTGHGSRWTATILDISLGGIRLLLPRRFEPRAILTIELSGKRGEHTWTGLARVVHVAPQKDASWILGCKFFSPLSDDELQGLVPNIILPNSDDELQPAETIPLGPSRLARSVVEEEAPKTLPLKKTKATSLSNVHFQIEIQSGERIDCLIRHLNVPSSWPLVSGKTLTMTAGTSKGPLPKLKLQVNHCSQNGEDWSLECRLLNPSTELSKTLRQLNNPTLART